MIAACRSECGLMCRGIPRPSRSGRPSGTRHAGRSSCCSGALADQVQHPVPAQGLGVVLDPHRSGLRRAQRVDAEQERQRAVVDGDGLGDLQEPDQLEPVQAVDAGLIAVDLRRPGMHGRVGRDQPVDVGEPEEPAHPVHHRDHRGVHQTPLPESADVQLDMRTLYANQRIQPVALAPGEPSRSWNEYKRCVRPEYRSRNETAASCAWTSRTAGTEEEHSEQAWVTSRGDTRRGPRPARRDRDWAQGRRRR